MPPDSSLEESSPVLNLDGATGVLPLRVNFAWTFVGNVIYAACQWGMVVGLAKVGTPEMIGQFALGLAITAPVIMFANLALRPVQATDARRQYGFSDYLSLRIITTLLAFLAIVGIAVVGRHRAGVAWAIILIGLAKGFEAVSDIYYGLLQQHEKMKRIAISMIIKGSLALAAVVSGVYFIHSVAGGALGMSVAFALILVLYDIPSGVLIANSSPETLLNPRWHWPTLSRLTWLALPLGLATMLISLIANIPRYFIAYHLGEKDLGFFAAIAYLMVAGGTVVNALGQSASPRLAKYYAAEKTSDFRRLLLRLLGVGAALGLAGVLIAWVAGKEILTFFYHKEYGDFANVLVWMMAAAGISYIASLLGYAMTAVHYFRIQLVIFTLCVLLSALFCFVLIPGYGILGASWAVGLTGGLQMLFSLACVARAIYYAKTGGKVQP